MFADIFSMIFALVGTVCVILITYYASKWYAKRMGPLASGKYIKVVDRLVVSKTGSIIIVDVEGIQYMIGVSEQNVQIMKQLDDKIPFPLEQDTTKDSLQNFKSILNRWRGVD